MSGKEPSQEAASNRQSKEKAAQVKGVFEHWEKLTDPSYPVAFLDKKWFYTTNCWRKMKELPRGPTEKNEPDDLWKAMIRNRRYTVKAMYLGVVDCTQDEYNFDGRIMIERLTSEKVLTCASKNQNFMEDMYTNEAI